MYFKYIYQARSTSKNTVSIFDPKGEERDLFSYKELHKLAGEDKQCKQ